MKKYDYLNLLIAVLLLFGTSGYEARAQMMASVQHKSNLNRTEATPQKGKNLVNVLKELEEKYQVSFSYDRKTVENKYVDYAGKKFRNLKSELDFLAGVLNFKYEKLHQQVYLLTSLERISAANEPLRVSQLLLNDRVTESTSLRVEKIKPSDYNLNSSVLNEKITGRVTSKSDGQPLPGVSILVKGTQLGTITDNEGRFTLELSIENPVLVFSYIGFKSTEIVTGGRTHIELVLEESAELLQEAVVTALGIKRERRSLGYAVGNVEGEALTQTPQNNVLNALSGKVAGVQISQMGGGVGSTVSMVIRGANSLNNDNQPLFVIDGVPVANRIGNGFAGADMGNPISDINPNDIANISVLKGPSAAALYGSRAGNGVVLITTKSGSSGKKGIGVSLNTSLVFDKPMKYLAVQNKFGSGKTGAHVLEEAENESWGAELDAGEMWEQWNSNGEKVPLVSYPDRFKDFFQTGVTNTNNVSVNGNYDKGNFRLSFGNMSNKGIVPNTDLHRTTMALNTTYNLTNRLSASASINITESGSNNRPMIDASRNDPVRSIYETGSQVNINDLREYWEPGLEGITQRKYKEKQNNPFYLVYENPTGFKRDRTVSRFQLDYDLNDHWLITARYSRDAYEEILEAKKAYNNYENPNGAYDIANNYRKETNLDLMVSYNKNFNDNWSLNAMAGVNRLAQYARGISNSTSELVVPGLYTISNGAPGTITNSSYLSEKMLYGVFGSASIGFKDIVYLDLTARNDWTSTLKKGSNSYFYPSASLSVIGSDLFDLPTWISFAKLRAGFAQVGNDVSPYSLDQTYSTALDWGTAKRMYMGGTLRNPDLKPEISTSHEIGVDFRFLNNKLGLEATYYERGNKNQVLLISTPIESGASSKQINAGLVQSRGFELGLNATPVSNDDFRWDMNITLTRNRTSIKRLAEGITFFPFVNNYSGVEIRTYEGGDIGDIYMRPVLTVKDQSSPYYGYPIVTSGGLYQTDNDLNNLVKIGNFNHDFLFGFQPTLTYKNFTLFANIDWRQGGEFFSNTMMFLGNNGQLEETLSGVEYDPNRSLPEQIKENPDKYLGKWIGGRNGAYGGMPWPEGSPEAARRLQDASLNPGVFETRDAAGNVVYVENLGGPGSKWLDPFSAYRYAHRPFPNRNLYSATYVKLREISVTYHLPKTLVNRMKLQNASIAVVGNNLFMWTSHGIAGLDPERAFRQVGSGWNQGVEYYNVMPWTGSIGFKLNVDF